MHWVSLQMTKLKEKGGMGFKELWTFIAAMLMKMAWRIYPRSNSLIGRALKGIYFPQGDFLEAKRGPKAS